jgi:ribosomal protein S18 acetylase RimI-like enzyme
VNQGPSVTQATALDRPRVVATIVAAFAEEPAFHHFFGDAETFADLSARLAGYLFDKRLPTGGALVVEGGAAVSLWDPPKPIRSDPSAHGSMPALELPQEVLDRMNTYDTAVHTLIPETPHWYLGVLATHPSHAGKRWGRAVMDAGLALAARAGLPAYLETTTASNVALYSRSGWTVCASVRVSDLTVSVMTHPPE